ncbi:zinc ribbon domain-containing protein [Chthonomonas calidirosea]|uniref:zinc ribbon domain-containing protein n=1 Tax=Chthonomonas calidirosea TaxID=454171 RepID=UPI003CE505D4
MRAELHARTFNRLKLFLGYEGRCRGAVLIEGDLCSSSQPCSACGHCEDANRKSQEKLGGVRCGFEANADFHAALKLKAGGANCQRSDVLGGSRRFPSGTSYLP